MEISLLRLLASIVDQLMAVFIYVRIGVSHCLVLCIDFCVVRAWGPLCLPFLLKSLRSELVP